MAKSLYSAIMKTPRTHDPASYKGGSDRSGPNRAGPDRGNPDRPRPPGANPKRLETPDRSPSQPLRTDRAGQSERSGRPDQLHLPSRPPNAGGQDFRKKDEPHQGYRAAKSQQGARPDQERRPVAGAPPGTVWLYGVHAVVAALGNPARRLRRLLLTPEAEATITSRLPAPWPLQPERVDRARLDQLLGRDMAHQGVALLADPLAPPQLAHALERPGPLLILDQVNDPRNVGAILRTAAVFGVSAVITQDRNAPEETGAMAKAASGALETVPLIRAVNIARTLVALKAAGVWIVGLDAAGAKLSGAAFAGRRVALVLGSEGEGLRRLTRDTCDELAGIQMQTGKPITLDSLNVSSAAAIALYELSRTP